MDDAHGYAHRPEPQCLWCGVGGARLPRQPDRPRSWYVAHGPCGRAGGLDPARRAAGRAGLQRAARCLRRPDAVKRRGAADCAVGRGGRLHPHRRAVAAAHSGARRAAGLAASVRCSPRLRLDFVARANPANAVRVAVCHSHPGRTGGRLDDCPAAGGHAAT